MFEKLFIFVLYKNIALICLKYKIIRKFTVYYIIVPFA